MTTASSAWEAKRTEETRDIERRLGLHFETVDAYRYNSASIRVRVIDSRFESLTREQRDTMVEKHLAELPEKTQIDITTLFTFAPSELQGVNSSLRASYFNFEFEEPSQSVL